MRRIIRPFAVLFSVMLLMASCLESDDYSDYVYYSDTAITSFSLGTLKHTVWTKASDGETDSSYVEDLDASGYDFYIDQQKKEIYNPDSLPVHTDAAHVLCNVSSKNGGVVILAYKNSEGEDSLAYYSDTDSIDFTEPREFRVYANDGRAYRAYTVKVNVHQENPDSINWHKCGANTAFTAFTAMKAVVLDKKLFVFGSDLTGTSVFSASTDGSITWEELEPNIALDGNAYKNVIVNGGSLYTLSGGNVLRSTDGKTWTETGGSGLKQLLAAGKSNMDGLFADVGMFVSEDGGATWAEDNVADDIAMMPTDNVSYGSFALATDENTERIIIVGNRDINNSAYAEDSVAMAWSKIEEYAAGSRQHSWIFNSEYNGYRLPRLSNLSVIVYDDALVALGGSGLGTSTAEAFSHFYVSEDYGLTWHTDDTYYLPEGFANGDKDVFTMTSDDDNYIWVVCGGTGEVWRGRLNRLGWENEQTSFEE